MKSSLQKESNIQFRNISVEFFHWRAVGWSIFTLLTSILYFIELSEYAVLGTNIPSILWIIGIVQLIRFIIQYIYEIPHKNSRVNESSNEKDKTEPRYLSKIECFGCAKELNLNNFQKIQNNIIEPLHFTSLDIKGHFCKNCANSYYNAELMFDLVSTFTIFSIFLSIFIFKNPTQVEIIILIVFMIICGVVITAVLIYDRIKMLKKYK